MIVIIYLTKTSYKNKLEKGYNSRCNPFLILLNLYVEYLF